MPATWFGESWGAPFCTPDSHVDVPVGASCIYCHEVLVAGDQGVTLPSGSLHTDCLGRTLLGGANHISRLCRCYGGSLPSDPPGLTLRQAATLACETQRAELSTKQ